MRGTFFGNLTVGAIRTYNFKRATVVDHRSGVSRPLKETMDGDLQPFVDGMEVPSEAVAECPHPDAPTQIIVRIPAIVINGHRVESVIMCDSCALRYVPDSTSAVDSRAAHSWRSKGSRAAQSEQKP